MALQSRNIISPPSSRKGRRGSDDASEGAKSGSPRSPGSPSVRTVGGAPAAPTSPSERRIDQPEGEPEPGPASQDLPDSFEGDFVEDIGSGNGSIDSETEEREVVINDGESQFTLRVPQPLLLTSTIARGAYHQCGTARRVKVYELAGETWEDRGTGYCAGVYDEGHDEALLVARLEEHSIKLEGAMPDPRRPPNRLDSILPIGSEGEGAEGTPAETAGPFPYFLIVSQDLSTDAIMLKSRVVKEDVYQKQQETLVVWTEPDGTDMALSFQEAEGCLEVWEFIIEVQKHFHLNSGMAQEVLSDPPTPDPGSPSSADFGVSALGMGGSMMQDAASIALPEPSLSTVQQIDAMLKNASSRNATLRERVAEWLARSNYIRKLIGVFHDAEDLENLEALHGLCTIMQTIVMMNDSMIIETILQDDVYLDVVGMFEYDPDFPTLKASYRDYIQNTAQYKQVVPIDDPKVVVKIHQAYRLQYLKDVILARILDDAMFSVLNSWIFFHQVDIVNYCTSNDAFLPRVFAICAAGSSDTTERKHEAVFLLQHLCAMGKQIQLPARITLCKTLAEKGLLPVVEYALFEEVTRVRNAAAEMLMILVEYDPNSVRNHVLEQVNKKESTLVTKAADILHSTEDLGLKAQMAEALRILFDNSAETAPPNASLAAAAAAARTKGEPDKFLTWFYESDVEHVFSPLRRLQRVNQMAPTALLDLSPRHYSAVLGHICDLLCYAVAQHSFRSQYYVITSDIGAHVGSLLCAKEKHMRLAAIKFFRTCLAANNQFMNRHFAKHGIFESLLRLMQRESARDNLVLSACLDLFEAITTQNIRSLIAHLATEPCRSMVTSLGENKYTGKCFRTLMVQWETPNASKTGRSAGGAGPDVSASMSFGSDSTGDSNDLHTQAEHRRRARDLSARGVHLTASDEDEDQYFNEDDDEDENDAGDEGEQDEGGQGKRRRLVRLPQERSLRRTGPSPNLVPYGDDDNASSSSSDDSPTSSSDDLQAAAASTAAPSIAAASSSDTAVEGDDDGEGGFLREDDGSDSPSSKVSSRKRRGDPLVKPGANTIKKISLGLSNSSRKMAAGSSEQTDESVDDEDTKAGS